MGTIKKRRMALAPKRFKNGEVRRAILATVATAGVLTLAPMAPGMAPLLKYLNRGKIARNRMYERVSIALNKLEKRGFVQVTGEYAKRRVKLTRKGEKEIEKIETKEYTIPPQVMWDGKWRVLMFDVSEKRRRVRNQLRAMLESVGFVRLQDSVWVYPYPCEEYVQLVRAHLRSGVGELRVLVAEALEKDSLLRSHFELP